MSAPPRPPSMGSRMNAPRPIFLGWLGLTILTGGGYYFAKKRNYAKRQEIMREMNAQRGRELGDGQDLPHPVEGGGSGQEAMRARVDRTNPTGPAKGAAESPLQALLGQLNKQTSMRKRNAAASGEA